MTEAELQHAVIELAGWRRWLIHHDRPARTAKGWRTAISGDAGFPDLVLVRDRVLFVELKSGRGRLTTPQDTWRTTLLEIGAAYWLWRPSDWESGLIEQVLK